MELNLREIIIKEDITINIMAFMGGVELKLPKEVNIKSDVSEILGGIDIKNSQMPEINFPIIYLQGTTFMGGVEIY